MSALHLARAGVGALPLYNPDSLACTLDLSDGTNLWGAPPAALRAIREFAPSVARYPSTYSSHLHAAILEYVGVGGRGDVSMVLGCGSDEIIDCTMRAFGAPGDRVSFCAPTFSMVPIFACLNALEADPIPFAANGDIDPQRLVERRAKITYLCTPNNPTGTAASRAAVEYVVDNADGIVLLDEAYAEFARESFDALVLRSDRLVVTRTFSKAFGLAGLRCGFGFGASPLVELVAKARGPYKVNALAEHAVAAALEESPDGREWVRTHAALAVENRERLAHALTALAFPAVVSESNFILVPSVESDRIFKGLCDRGIVVRLMKGLSPGIPSLVETDGAALRFGVGPWEMMDALLTALREVA